MTRVRVAARSMWMALALVLALVLAGHAGDAGEGSGFDLQAALTRYIGLVPGGATAVIIRDGQRTAVATGIADASGRPMTPDTPFNVGPSAGPIDHVIALQLVEEGRLSLDDRVETYLPGAPVGAGATVRDLLTGRAGVPNIALRLQELSLADPQRVWTRDEVVRQIDPADAATVGTLAASVSSNWVTMQLIEAVEGTDYQSVLAARVTEPLGMSKTGVVGPGWRAPPGMASGWNLDLGLVGDPATEIPAVNSLDPRVSSASDMATFLEALLDGRLVSQETLALMFDPDAEGFAYGFDQHEMLFGDLGDIGARYGLMGGSGDHGHWGTIAADPRSGDVIVVLSNNRDNFVPILVREIALAWAEEA